MNALAKLVVRGVLPIALAGPAIAQPCAPTLHPLGAGIEGRVYSLAAFGPGDDLYAGGDFDSASGVPAEGIARWDGAVWHPVGGGVSGGTWAAVTGMLAVEWDGAPALFVGGDFEQAGETPVRGLARWDGNQWHDVGGGVGLSGTFSPYFPPLVAALALFDDGRGEALYVGGRFGDAGGTPAANIARWDGQHWEALGSGVTGPDLKWGIWPPFVRRIAIFDQPGGVPALHATGMFSACGRTVTLSIARWDGSQWWPLGKGLEFWTYSASGGDLLPFDDGDGVRLFVVGQFNQPFMSSARWTGAQWLPAPSPGIFPRALAVFDDGTGPTPFAASNTLDKWIDDNFQTVAAIGVGQYAYGNAFGVIDRADHSSLYMGGSFTIVGGVAADNIVEYRGCPRACYANCDGDTLPNGAPKLDIDDFLCFQTAFALRDPYADCDGNQVFNVEDFVCFQLAFTLGCG